MPREPRPQLVPDPARVDAVVQAALAYCIAREGGSVSVVQSERYSALLAACRALVVTAHDEANTPQR